jgi:hypothetical protein
MNETDVKAICNCLLDLVENWVEDYYGANGMTDELREGLIFHAMSQCPLPSKKRG